MGQRYSRIRLAEYVSAAIDAGKPVSNVVAAFLVDNGSTSDLDSLMRDVMELRARRNGIVEVTAQSSYPLSTSIKSEIEDVARGLYPSLNELVIHEIVDKTVIGGVRLIFANASLDLTVESKLNKLREAVV